MKKLFILTVMFSVVLSFGQKNYHQLMNVNIEQDNSILVDNRINTIETTNTNHLLDFNGPTNYENQDTMYCLVRDRNEYGNYNGKRAQFSVWKPRSGFSCCVIVNISRGNKIIARQRVSVTKSKMLRVLIGEVDGVTQGVSPCN